MLTAAAPLPCCCARSAQDSMTGDRDGAASSMASRQSRQSSTGCMSKRCFSQPTSLPCEVQCKSQYVPAVCIAVHMQGVSDLQGLGNIAHVPHRSPLH